jgi:uncharacterized membrane protein YwzB
MKKVMFIMSSTILGIAIANFVLSLIVLVRKEG